MREDVLLEIRHLHKRFGFTHANNDINLTIKKGEIRCLAGENGSGKSTLTSIISGLQPYDEGEMLLNGEEYKPASSLEANSFKVAMVVQEMGVIPPLTGAMNIFLGKTDQFKRFGILDMKAMNQAAREIFEKWEITPVPLNIPCAQLTMEQRKLVEVAHALYIDPDLLVLDEITQSLSQDTRTDIYKLKERFKRENRSMIIISHDIEETMEIGDSVTVLRDGEVVDTILTRELSVDEVKHMMVGRKMEGSYMRKDREPSYEDTVLLDVESLGLSDGSLQDISFQLHKGEILAVCGLSDAGIHKLGSAVFGIVHSKRTGSVTDVRTGRKLHRPQDMMSCGGGYLSKNRDEEGLMLNDSIKNNLYLPSAGDLSGAAGFTKPGRIQALAKKAFEDFEVKAVGLNQRIGSLSGGNKQKVNLARWLVKDLSYAILDCPTRGVDIGVKAYIYETLLKKKENGLGCLLITDELAEALGMADRILIIKEGRISKVISRGESFDEKYIIEVMI